MPIPETLQASIKQLAPVPREAALAYEQSAAELTNQVDELLQDHPNLERLTGGLPLRMMCENHRHHAAFMGTVFRLNCFELLAVEVPWVYRTYHSFGFDFDYFPLELRAWQTAIRERLSTAHARPILTIYDWMLERHVEMIEYSKQSAFVIAPPPAPWRETASAFLATLLKGDHSEARELAESMIGDHEDLAAFYENVIQWSLYEIGERWENNELSVAQEHLASAIVTCVMAATYLKCPNRAIRKHRAVVAAVANEQHETGAWMLSDLLESDGWNVDLLGANTPQQDILLQVRRCRPHVLALSVTMPFNLQHAVDVIGAVKTDPELLGMHVMIGGQVFNRNPELWKLTGADSVASSASEAVTLLRNRSWEALAG